MTDVPRYVVDSSVISKIFLLDEPHVEETRRLFESFSRGELDLITPALAYEVANSIVKATRARRLDAASGREALTELFLLDMEIGGNEILTQLTVERAYRVAEELRRSIYDAVFLVVSRAFQAPLITADKPLWEAARDDFSVVWLPDLQLP